MNERIRTNGNTIFTYLNVIILTFLLIEDSFATFPSENLNQRALIALPQTGGQIYVSWRMLKNDAENTSFKLYRKAENSEFRFVTEIKNSSNYRDMMTEIGKMYTYYVIPTTNDLERPSSNPYTVNAVEQDRQYIKIDLASSGGVVHLAAGDVDADGMFDYVAQVPAYIDPNSNETYKLEAYNSFGEFLWRRDTRISPDPIDLGPVWTMAYIMWDMDGDNKAEVLARMRMDDRYFLAAFEGLSGDEKGRIEWPRRVNIDNDRHVIAIAYLDGEASPPSVILQVGTYQDVILNAYDFTGNGFRLRWSKKGLGDGTAGHGIDIIDVDGDGRDEIVQGASLIDEHGNLIWTTNLGHMDIMMPGDINPLNPGFEIFYGTCYPIDKAREGAFLVDMDDGSILWEHSDLTEPNLYHLHGGWAANVTDKYPGWECWAHNKPKNGTSDQPYLYHGVTGEIISREWITNQDPISWDDDDELELTIKTGNSYRIFNFPNEKIVDCPGEFLMIMDLLGDFRDELVVTKGNAFYIWTNTELSQRKKISPLFDRHYRLDVARSGSGYFRHSSVLYINQNLGTASDNMPPTSPTGILVSSP